MFSAQQVADAARLVSFAIQPGARPSTEPEYDRLLIRFLDNTDEFARCVDGVLTGFRLRLVDATVRSGLVVAASDISPLALRIGDYRKRLDGEWATPDKYLHGLLHVALATYCFPTDQARRAADTVPVTVAGFQTWLDRETERLAAATDDVPATGIDELDRGWRMWRRLADVSDSTDKRSVPSSKPGRIRQVLDVLTHQNLLRQTGEATWETTERYRFLVSDAAVDDAFVSFAAQVGGTVRDRQEVDA